MCFSHLSVLMAVLRNGFDGSCVPVVWVGSLVSAAVHAATTRVPPTALASWPDRGVSTLHAPGPRRPLEGYRAEDD